MVVQGYHLLPPVYLVSGWRGPAAARRRTAQLVAGRALGHIVTSISIHRALATSRSSSS